MSDATKRVLVETLERPKVDGSTLLDAIKTTSRLVPRQITDEIELAKLELQQKKARLGGIGIFAGAAVLFVMLLVIALVVAAIAGLAVVLPLWLAALIICAALLLATGIAALIGYRKFKSLLPLMPERAWRGIRHDLGIAKEGSDFDASTLIQEKLSKEEKKAKAAQAQAQAEKEKAERDAKAAENGPKASAEELVLRTAARREHLTVLRAELIEQADVKKQGAHLLDFAKDKAGDSVRSSASGVLAAGRENMQGRWKPLAVFAVSASACAFFLRKLFKN